jgi:GTP-binding protein
MTPAKAKRPEFFLQNVSFLKSTTNSSNFPSIHIPEIAIVGRSNAGKSSVLNTLCRRKQLAHTSKTPGKTRLINFFSINDGKTEIARIVDLPGYGYAKVDKSTKHFWNDSLLKFLLDRENLIGVILVTDLRHALGKLDQKLLTSLSHRMLYFHILFNKSDKLNKSDQAKNVKLAIHSFLINMPKFNQEISHSVFSSLKKKGVRELFTTFNIWLDNHKSQIT